MFDKLKNYTEKVYKNDNIKEIYQAKYNKIEKLANLGKYLILNNIYKLNDNEIKTFIQESDTKNNRFINYVKKLFYLSKYISIKCVIDLKLKNIIRDISFNDCNQLLNML